MEQKLNLADDQEFELDVDAISEFLRLNSAVIGIVLGLMGGLAVFLATNLLVIKGGPVVGPHMALLGQFLIGYEVTFRGSIIGFFEMFGCGFLLGFFLAWSYNLMVDFRARRAACEAEKRAKAIAYGPRVSLRATDARP